MEVMIAHFLEAINRLLKILTTSYAGGILFLILGIILIKRQLKEKVGDVDWSSPLQGYIKGWVASIGMTILGIVIIVLKLFNKL